MNTHETDDHGDMLQPADIKATEEMIEKLLAQIDYVLKRGSSDDYKDMYVEQISNFAQIGDFVEEMGYEPTREGA